MTEKLTVKDLRNFLTIHGMSPERFASEVGLSHMTIRRWLKKPNQHEIPHKYLPILGPRLKAETAATTASPTEPFDAASALKSLNVGKMMDEIEKSGRGFKDLKTLKTDLMDKFKNERFDKIFTRYCKSLLQAAVSKETPLHVKAIAIGALLYFINPIDLIPDTIPVFGYLDDLAVLSIAVNYLNDYRS